MQRKQSGFTIVELVVVIILLGILAATALPRFIDLDDEAHTAAFEAVNGSLQTGISLAHAAAVAGDLEQDDNLADYGLVITAEGFPYAAAVHATSTVAESADCVEVFTNVQQAGAPSVGEHDNRTTIDTAFVSGEDFAAIYISGNNTCEYWHTGHSTTNGENVGLLTYDPATGQVTATTTAIL